MSSKPRALVIDDDSDLGEYVCDAARGMGWDCTAATDAPSFLAQLAPDVSLIFLDLLIPGVDGIELLRLLSAQQCSSRIILMSGIGKRIMETAREMAQVSGLHVVGHLQKPFELVELERMLEQQRDPIVQHAPLRGRMIMFTDEELTAAIDRDELVLHYQPQIEIGTRRVVGVEALVRWMHPQRGLTFPNDFMPRMEVLGLVDRLGMTVAKHSLNEVGRFADDEGITPTISINVSAHSLHDLSLPDALEDLARSSAVRPDKITLEITESGLIHEPATTLDILTRLRMKGIHLSIDDFGTGYAMMKQLRNIPANELKIDRSFVEKMCVSHGDNVMVLKTIEIGHDLGMKVVAEGVETDEQLELLLSHGCDVAQGYLFSHPLPSEELMLWLKSYRSSDTLAG